MVFLHVRRFTFCPFGCPLGSHPGSWWEESEALIGAFKIQ
jgi:hypothetical protein